MNIRKQQIESTLKRAISQIIARKLSDPRVVGLVSVTGVKFDMATREAAVSVSVMPQRHESRTLHGLQSSAGRIQSLLSQTVSLKTVPHLRFMLDDTLKKQDAVYEAIDRGLARERPAPADAAESPDDGSTTSPDASLPEESGR